MQFSDIQNAVKKFIFSLFGAATLFIIAWIVFFFWFSILRPDGFMVLWWNFDTNYRKFPFDQKSIDFTLSSDVKLESVKNENFEVSPKIDGVWSLKNSHTLSYTFGEKIKEGESISFTLKSSIESKKWEKLTKDYTYDINVVSSPRIIKITPSGNLENLSQNIAVFFNIPMVPLTSLEKKDTLPCPLEITPKLLWKCQWTTSSVLEFIPQSGFEGATKYTVTFKNVPGLLYTIGTPTSIEIVTPSLKIIESSRFTPWEGIPLDFNFAVDQSAIQKNVEVYGFGSGKIDSDISLSQDQQDLITPTYTGSLVEKEKTLGVVKKIDYTIVPKPDSQNSFFLIPKVWKFEHLSFYKVMVKKGLIPKLWNIALEKDSLSYSLSYSFLQNLEVFRNLFSQTGALIDTRSFWISPSVLPVKNVFFQLNFEQEIATLDTWNFLFQTSGGQNIGFDIQYIKEPSDIKEPWKDTFKTIENKKRISLTLKSDLLPNTQYNFIVKKQINPDLGEDIVYHFQTPPSLAVSDFKFVGYAKSCLYFNNPIDNVWDKKDKIVTTSPASKISSVTDYEWIPEDVLKFNDDEIVKKGYCPNPKNGNSLYILSTRMNPNTEYTLSTVNTLNDMYGNTLALPVEKKVKTGQIEPKDKYLYISLSKEINVIPSQIPITINLQTVNLDNVDIDICEMSPQEYMEYTVNKYTQNYEPHCSQKTRTNLKVKDKFWTLSSNKFDLENDILKRKITSNIVLVRGYKDGVEKDFENTFIKSNLSLVFEKGGNKSLLFVSDFLVS